VITTIATPKNLRIVSFAAGAAAIAAAAVYMTASAAGYSFNFGGPKAANVPAAGTVADKSSANASGVCNEFAAHFSSDLGVSQDKVNTAFQQAVGQTLADEVKAGHLTQAQADAIKKKMTSQAPCTLAGSLGGRNAAGGAVYQQALLSAAASALGITSDTLKADLAKGMTLHQIADAQNPPVTEAQFRSKLIASLKPVLDKAVTNKKITSAQEQKILTALQTGPIPFWDKPMRKPAAAASPGA
jgi:hypothetical protein